MKPIEPKKKEPPGFKRPLPRIKANWDKDAPMVITSETKYTYGKSPVDPRRTGTHTED